MGSTAATAITLGEAAGYCTVLTFSFHAAATNILLGCEAINASKVELVFGHQNDILIILTDD